MAPRLPTVTKLALYEKEVISTVMAKAEDLNFDSQSIFHLKKA